MAFSRITHWLLLCPIVLLRSVFAPQAAGQASTPGFASLLGTEARR